jgi:hypothetical protein
MEYTIEDTFDVSAKRYWEVFFDQAYNEAQWKHLDIDWELLEFERRGEGDDLVIVRKQRLTPRRDVPKMLKKLVKGAIQYVEHNDFKARESRMLTKTVPNFGADRIDNHGIFRVENVGPDKCKRIWEGHCSCSIPLLGGTVERHLVGEIRESFDRGTNFTRRWFAEHPA